MDKFTITSSHKEGISWGKVNYQGTMVSASWYYKSEEEIRQDPWSGLQYIHLWEFHPDRHSDPQRLCLAVEKVTQRSIHVTASCGGLVVPFVLARSSFGF